MNLQVYFQSIRDLEATITAEFPVIVSLATGDGGKAGTLTEVPRRLAAQMVVDNQAVLASEEQATAYRTALADRAREAEQAAAASRMQISVLSTRELEQLKAEARKTKG